MARDRSSKLQEEEAYKDSSSLCNEHQRFT